jgi:vacuolar-type H+-ATPase subunit E/Vma4
MSGIENIVEIIEGKAKERADSILAQAETNKRTAIEEVQKKADAVREGIIKKAQAESKAELSRVEANAKLKAKYQVLESKEAVMKEVLSSADEKIRKEVKGKNYQSILTQLAVAGGVALDADALEFVLPKGHAETLDIDTISKKISAETGKKVAITISKETVRATGGLIVRTPDRLKMVDNTFEARFERRESTIRDEISKILFVAEK